MCNSIIGLDRSAVPPLKQTGTQFWENLLWSCFRSAVPPFTQAGLALRDVFLTWEFPSEFFAYGHVSAFSIRICLRARRVRVVLWFKRKGRGRERERERESWRETGEKIVCVRREILCHILLSGGYWTRSIRKYCADDLDRAAFSAKRSVWTFDPFRSFMVFWNVLIWKLENVPCGRFAVVLQHGTNHVLSSCSKVGTERSRKQLLRIHCTSTCLGFLGTRCVCTGA